MLAVILSMLWDHEREFAYAWSGCTISNLSDTCMDSLHTGDLSPQTQFRTLCAIKVPFWGAGAVVLFWITMTQHVFDEAEKATPDLVSFIWFKAPSDVRPSFPLPLREQSEVNATLTVKSMLQSLSWPRGGGGPLLWVASQALQGGEGNLMPWFPMSGLVNMPQTVVKDDNENAGCQSAQHNESIFQNAMRGRGEEAGGVSVSAAEVKNFMLHRQAAAFTMPPS